jgi:hypothetical protein
MIASPLCVAMTYSSSKIATRPWSTSTEPTINSTLPAKMIQPPHEFFAAMGIRFSDRTMVRAASNMVCIFVPTG